MKQDRKDEVPAAPEVEPRSRHQQVASAMPTVELVKEITREVGELARKQIELARTELRADVRREIGTVAGLGVAALAAVVGLTLLLVTAILGLAEVMRGWVAGLIVSGFVLAAAAVAGLVGWRNRVRTPLERTRRNIREQVRLTKERIA